MPEKKIIVIILLSEKFYKTAHWGWGWGILLLLSKVMKLN